MYFTAAGPTAEDRWYTLVYKSHCDYLCCQDWAEAAVEGVVKGAIEGVAEGALEGAKGKAEHPKEHCPSTKVAVTSGIAEASPVRVSNRLCWKTLKSALMPGLHKQQVLNSKVTQL